MLALVTNQNEIMSDPFHIALRLLIVILITCIVLCTPNSPASSQSQFMDIFSNDLTFESYTSVDGNSDEESRRELRADVYNDKNCSAEFQKAITAVTSNKIWALKSE